MHTNQEEKPFNIVLSSVKGSYNSTCKVRLFLKFTETVMVRFAFASRFRSFFYAVLYHLTYVAVLLQSFRVILV